MTILNNTKAPTAFEANSNVNGKDCTMQFISDLAEVLDFTVLEKEATNPITGLPFGVYVLGLTTGELCVTVERRHPTDDVFKYRMMFHDEQLNIDTDLDTVADMLVKQYEKVRFLVVKPSETIH